jgi:tRNA threonylcarbamoyladenosine biosynthesis protein TsaB
MGHNLTIAIETSGRLGSAAIGRGDDLILDMPFSGQLRHGAELFSTLEALLGRAGATARDIGQVYITAGPGSFTGLRIAVTAAKMFGFAKNAKIVAADTMEVIAENISACTKNNERIPDCICTVLDAKKDFFYAAVFDRVAGQWKKSFGTEIVTADQMLDWLAENGKKNVGLLGEGLVFYAKRFESRLTCLLDESCWPATAAGLYRVGRRMAKAGLFTDPVALKPTYLRQPDAIAKKNPSSR